jgi:glucose-6-phosphate 1-epimerase
MTTLELLNQQFANDKIRFSDVADGLFKAELHFAEHAVAQVHLQGAHLSRWRDTNGQENIFTSQKAVYQHGVPIRGGNPIIFPQFGAGEICQHGFARNSIWRVIAASADRHATAITFALSAADIDSVYRRQWAHDFFITLTISLSETLSTEMKIINPNSYPLAFTHGFHTYLAVSDIHCVEIDGLSGLNYMDNLRGRQIFSESGAKLTIAEFIDRRYQAIPTVLRIQDKSAKRTLMMETKNCADAFVWNPWLEGGKKIADLAPTDYEKFICVEPGNMTKPIVLEPEREFITVQTLKFETY